MIIIEKICIVENFTIRYAQKDEHCIHDIIKIMSNAQKTIFNFLDMPPYAINIEVLIYSSIIDFHNKVYGKLKEKWNVCATKEHTIHTVSPLFPCEPHKYSDMLLIISKATQDVILNTFFNEIPKWLGITILNSKLMTAQITHSNPQLPHFKKPDYHSDSESYFIANFILEKFGRNIVMEILKRPNDYNEILQLSDFEIDKQLKEYYEKNH